jgi:hypothetical protein
VQFIFGQLKQMQRVLRMDWMRTPHKHDELRASRGILVSVGLGVAFWLVIIIGIVLLIKHFAH